MTQTQYRAIQAFCFRLPKGLKKSVLDKRITFVTLSSTSEFVLKDKNIRFEKYII